MSERQTHIDLQFQWYCACSVMEDQDFPDLAVHQANQIGLKIAKSLKGKELRGLCGFKPNENLPENEVRV